MLPWHSRDPSQRGLIGTPSPPKDVEDRQRDRDRDALQDSEQRDTEERSARPGLPPKPLMGRIVAAIIGPSEESGPSTRMRDGPNAA